MCLQGGVMKDMLSHQTVRLWHNLPTCTATLIVVAIATDHMYQYILTLAADGECLQFLLDHDVVGAIIKMMTKLSSHSAAQQVRPSVALQLSCFSLLFVFSAPPHPSPFTPPL